jgi:carbamate kinase
MALCKPILVVALGGNALLQRGQPMSFETQRDNATAYCHGLAQLGDARQLVFGLLSRPEISFCAKGC